MIRAGENKNYRFIPFLSGVEQKMQKKKAKNLKELKKYDYGIISSQNSLERPRKRKIKIYRFVQFLPDALQKIPKKWQKIQKLKKIPLWHHFKPKSVERGG